MWKAFAGGMVGATGFEPATPGQGLRTTRSDQARRQPVNDLVRCRSVSWPQVDSAAEGILHALRPILDELLGGPARGRNSAAKLDELLQARRDQVLNSGLPAHSEQP